MWKEVIYQIYSNQDLETKISEALLDRPPHERSREAEAPILAGVGLDAFLLTE